MSHNANLTSPNIRDGVNIGGVVGNFLGKSLTKVDVISDFTIPDWSNVDNIYTSVNCGFKPDVVIFIYNSYVYPTTKTNIFVISYNLTGSLVFLPSQTSVPYIKSVINNNGFDVYATPGSNNTYAEFKNIRYYAIKF